jgi:hypothetical protein
MLASVLGDGGDSGVSKLSQSMVWDFRHVHGFPLAFGSRQCVNEKLWQKREPLLGTIILKSFSAGILNTALY